MADLTLRDLVKTYGQTEVLHGINLDVQDGEFVVFVGPSGCGKSTTLRMIAGLEEITSGTIEIGGRVVNNLEPKDRDIAMVFQNYAIYPHMSVRKNIGFGLRSSKAPKTEKEKRIDDVAALLGMTDLLDRKPAQLSGGQRQRVAIGRAMVRDPAVFLFDEPLSNLDAQLRTQMRLEIKELQSSLGVTALYVTHDQVEAMTMADRMIVMNGGVAEQIGTPLEVYETPQTLFAAQFIGSPAMNVLDAHIDNGTVTLGGAEICKSLIRDGSVKLGLRPEHLFVDANGALDLTVQLSEPLGANTLLHGQLDQSGGAFTASLPGVHKIDTAGQRLRLSIAPEHIHLFDPATGQRLTA